MSGRRISDLLPLADLLPGFEILGGSLPVPSPIH